jgi:hypothetical protein
MDELELALLQRGEAPTLEHYREYIGHAELCPCAGTIALQNSPGMDALMGQEA